MGRPPSGPRLVQGLKGSGHAKKRLRVILETLTGIRTIASACQDLGINEAAFHKLRSRTLQEAVEGLEPRQVGRPPKVPSPEEIEIEALQTEIQHLKIALEAAHIREELAVTLPHVGRKKPGDASTAGKKTTPRRRKRPRGKK